MPTQYSMIEIFTNEEARHNRRPLSEAVVDAVRKMKIGARCAVMKGVDACYENGERASGGILALSFNMPITIEILLPTPELESIMPVIEEMVSEGIVAVRELKVYGHRVRKQLIPRHLQVRDVMTADPRYARRETPIAEVVRMLMDAPYNGLPVVDRRLRPIGMITQDDLVSRAGLPLRLGLLAELEIRSVFDVQEALKERTAETVMTRPAVTIADDASINQAVGEMLSRNLKRLPVVNSAGKLAGMLSRFDVLRMITQESPDWKALQEKRVIVEDIRLVSDVMQRDTQTVTSVTPLEEVLRVMDRENVQRVAVTDENDNFKGMISDRDLLAAFSSHPEGIGDYLSRLLSFGEKGRRHRQLQDRLRQERAGDIMQTGLDTVTEETRIDEAIGVMSTKGIKRMPVVDDNGRFRGLVSRDALLRAGFDQEK